MNNVLLRMKDIEMSRRTFARIACEAYGKTPPDVIRLLQYGYTKRVAEKRDYSWVLEILEIRGEELETYGSHKTISK